MGITNWDKLMLKIGAALFYYKLGQHCYKLEQLHYYKLGQVLLQIEVAITNWGKICYKIEKVLQIREIITNWGITGMYIFNDSLVFDDIKCIHPFFLWYCHQHFVKGSVFILHHFLQSSIIPNGLWLIQKILKDAIFIFFKIPLAVVHFLKQCVLLF